MATLTSSIIITHLTSATLYVDKFAVEIYSDSLLTSKVGAATCEVVWDTTALIWKQKTSVIFSGLTLGNTYYLRGGVVAPLSGVTTWTSAFSIQAGSISAPSVSYSGTYTATTSGVSFRITPSVTSDGIGGTTGIDHYEFIWTTDGSTPPSTNTPYASAHTVGTTVMFFAGAIPGTNITAFVRAVNMNQKAQAWQSLGTITVSTTWSGTTTGVIGDGTLLGTNGLAVYSATGGSTGLGGTPTAAVHVFGWQALTNAGDARISFKNSTGGKQNWSIAQDFSGANAFTVIQEGISGNSLAVGTGANVGINCTPTAPLMMNGVAVVQYAGGTTPNVVGNVNQSTNFINQGYIMAQTAPTWSISTSGTVDGSMTITLSFPAITMYRGDGSSFSLSASSFTWTGLSAATTYYFFPFLRTSDNTVHFACDASPSPSSTLLDPNTTPLNNSSGAPNLLYASLNQNQDGRSPLYNGHLQATTHSAGGGGGGTSGGGSGVCPEFHTPVTVRGRGMVTVGSVEVGDYLKGEDLRTGKTVYRKVLAKKTAHCAIWRRYKGKLITPRHPVWYKGAWTEPINIPSAKDDFTPGIAVKLTLDATEYADQNYWLGDEEVLMHNFTPSC